MISLGIGQGRVTQNLQGAPIDESLFINDQDSVNMVMTQWIFFDDDDFV